MYNKCIINNIKMYNKCIINNINNKANGIGKSTLLKLIMGFYQPLSGTLSINQKAKIAYFTQVINYINNGLLLLY